MAKFTLKHKTKPCSFVWEDDKLTKWEEVKDFFLWELKHDGLSNFSAYQDIDPKLKNGDTTEKAKQPGSGKPKAKNNEAPLTPPPVAPAQPVSKRKRKIRKRTKRTRR